MSVSAGFLSFVLEQLEPLGDVASRRMFGGVGLYAGDVFFAVIDNDTLFFKVDDTTVAPFLEAGMAPFQPYPDTPQKPGRSKTSASYYQVPVRVLEDGDALGVWAHRAVEVGRKTGSSRRRRRAPK